MVAQGSILSDLSFEAAARGNPWAMVSEAVTPARALARLMVAAFVVIVLTLLLTVGAVGVAGPGDTPGAAADTTAAASP